jgi:beta-xylosidase
MIEAIKIWNEPNNLSHWDFTIDPEWRAFSDMARQAAERVRSCAPHLEVVMGGISPIDPAFMKRLRDLGALDNVDAVAVHGFPLDWNHWQIDEWPEKVREIEEIAEKPVWVTEVGVSTFGADEIQVFGLQRTQELLAHVDRVYWYSLLDLPRTWEATTRHKESEGSSYYRHFYMGIVREDGTPKLAAEMFDKRLGICQWFNFEDPRLDMAVEWLRRLGVRRLRTGLSWADRYRENALEWFDRQMEAVEDFDVTLTLCFTPAHCGKAAHHSSPPVNAREFADFAQEMTERYAATPAAVVA